MWLVYLLYTSYTNFISTCFQDISNYLESELRIGQDKVAQEIRREVQEKASGVFMWVVLVVDILNKEHDRGRTFALRQRLQDIPADLQSLFRDILTRDTHGRDELVLCIQWVLFAEEPLHLWQLYYAIVADVVSAKDLLHTTGDTEAVIRRFLLDCSKGLTEVTGSLKVQFIHESVRDFLLKGNGLNEIWPDLQKKHSEPKS
jgi:hypothetical protein